MKAAVILAHPYPESFNHAIFEMVKRTLSKLNVEAYCHDLYLEGFDPILTRKELGKDKTEDPLVNQYTEEMLASDFLFFIHPNWWGQPPAILKGYIDRVFRPPYAYDFPEDASGGGLPVEKLNGKYGIVYNTSNTEADREENHFGDPLEKIWKKCVFDFCGIRKCHRRMFRIVADSTLPERQSWLEEVRQDVIRITGKDE